MTAILSIGAASDSGGNSPGGTSSGLGCEAVAFDQELRQRPSEQAGYDEPERRHRDAGLEGGRKAVLLGDGGTPGNGGSVSAYKRNRTDHHAGRTREAERHCSDCSDRVLKNDEGDRDQAEHREHPAARG